MLAAILISTFLAAFCVLLHYEALRRLADWTARLGVRDRTRVLLGLLGAMVAHVAEIWVFALSYFFLFRVEHLGSIAGRMTHGIDDYAYFSFTTYTTLGYGDLTPEGPIRIVAATEALLGLILVAWTASFLFMEMQRYWNRGQDETLAGRK